MAKLAIVSLICLIVAASSLTSCSAARGLPLSLPSDPISSSERTTSSKPTRIVHDVDSTQLTTSSTGTDFDKGVDSDMEEISEEELAACMEDGENAAEGSSSELELDSPCRRRLSADYGFAAPNKNKKGFHLNGYGPVGSHKHYTSFQGGGRFRRRLYSKSSLLTIGI